MREIRFPGHLVNSILMCFCPTGEGEGVARFLGASASPFPYLWQSRWGQERCCLRLSATCVTRVIQPCVHTRYRPSTIVPDKCSSLKYVRSAASQFTVASPDTCVFFNGAKTWPTTFLILHPPVCLLDEFSGHDRPLVLLLFYSLLAFSERVLPIFLFLFFFFFFHSMHSPSQFIFRIIARKIDIRKSKLSFDDYYLLIFLDRVYDLRWNFPREWEDRWDRFFL